MPITWGSPLAFLPLAMCLDDSAGGLTTLTLAPGGVAKLKLAAAGLTNEIDVKPTWNAGLAAPRANTWTRSGTFFVASMAIADAADQRAAGPGREHQLVGGLARPR